VNVTLESQSSRNEE
jgi:hypothetical protein